MDRDEILRQGKQTAADLRDTVSQKVSENEDTIKGTLGKAARWVDQKTGGKYADQIGKVESKVEEGIGWVASQGSSTPASGAPHGPVTPEEGSRAAAPHAAGAPGTTPPGPIAPDAQGPHRPQTPTAPDDDAPRPPQV